jgi:hypothetical protein
MEGADTHPRGVTNREDFADTVIVGFCADA